MIYLGCDHGGFALKKVIGEYLAKQGYAVTDCGNTVFDADDNFCDFVLPVVNGVKADPTNRGILICGSGVGMNIAANHHAGIRAAVVHNVDYARLVRQHNDINVLCLGGRFLDEASAKTIVDLFLTTAVDPNPKYKQRMNAVDGSK